MLENLIIFFPRFYVYTVSLRSLFFVFLNICAEYGQIVLVFSKNMYLHNMYEHRYLRLFQDASCRTQLFFLKTYQHHLSRNGGASHQLRVGHHGEAVRPRVLLHRDRAGVGGGGALRSVPR